MGATYHHINQGVSLVKKANDYSLPISPNNLERTHKIRRPIVFSRILYNRPLGHDNIIVCPTLDAIEVADRVFHGKGANGVGTVGQFELRRALVFVESTRRTTLPILVFIATPEERTLAYTLSAMVSSNVCILKLSLLVNLVS